MQTASILLVPPSPRCETTSSTGFFGAPLRCSRNAWCLVRSRCCFPPFRNRRTIALGGGVCWSHVKIARASSPRLAKTAQINDWSLARLFPPRTTCLWWVPSVHAPSMPFFCRRVAARPEAPSSSCSTRRLFPSFTSKAQGPGGFVVRGMCCALASPLPLFCSLTRHNFFFPVSSFSFCL